MNSALIFTRTVLFSAEISLAGIFVFATIVAAPAYAAGNQPIPAGLRRTLTIGAAISLALIVIAAIPWLLFVASDMSGQRLAALLRRGVIATVLTRTQFGHVWDLRVVLCVLVAPCVVVIGKHGAIWIGVALSATLLAATAWEGHAGADTGWQAVLHLAADAAHLLAAGSWLGALLPLALLLATARRAGDRASAAVARTATARFSTLGLVCVATLLVSGTVNGWFLVGTIPALIGTLYGQLLLAKIVLFLVMVGIAAVNRLRLSPRLATTDHGRKAVESRAAITRIARNAVVEASIGLIVIAIVGALGTLTPAAHQQPWWPFPYRLGLDAIARTPELRNDAIGTALLALLGLVLIAFGWYRGRRLLIATGLVLFLGLGWRPIQLLTIKATPLSYAESPTAFTVPSILAGEKPYAEHCVSCHGESGLGDGPLAAELPIAPADLTAHLTHHPDGDLFWFISHGMVGGVMPPFAAKLDDAQIWDVINLLKARADRVAAASLSAEVTAQPAPLAPDFAFAAAAGVPASLKALLARGAVLLVFPSARESPVAALFESERATLAETGASVVIAPDDPELRSVYSFYDPAPTTDAETALPLVAFLIDRDGYIRARWHPGDLPDWQSLDTLDEEIAAMERLGLAPAAPQPQHIHSAG